MIEQCFVLEPYNWTVYAFYDVLNTETSDIFNTLEYIGCNRKSLQEIMDNIEDGLVDNGFVYSNCIKRESVVVIGKGKSDEEAMNTLVHEARHLLQHIVDTLEISEDSEELYYIMGKLVQTMYKAFKYTL